jgi:hypothetical protein
MTSSVTIAASELKRLYQKIHDLTEENETLKSQQKPSFKTFMVIAPKTGKPYLTSDFTQARYLAVELTKSRDPVAVYGVEHLGQTNVSSVVNFEKI